MGDTFEVQVRIANRGSKAAKTRLRLTLRTEPTAFPAVVLSTANFRIRAGRHPLVELMLTVPPGAGGPPSNAESYAAGEYFLVACVRKRGLEGRKRCRAADSTISIEPEVGGQPTTPGPDPEYTPGSRTLDDYFQQWLYGTEKPTITPETF